jgi:hypothetical protein
MLSCLVASDDLQSHGGFARRRKSSTLLRWLLPPNLHRLIADVLRVAQRRISTRLAPGARLTAMAAGSTPCCTGMGSGPDKQRCSRRSSDDGFEHRRAKRAGEVEHSRNRPRWRNPYTPGSREGRPTGAAIRQINLSWAHASAASQLPAESRLLSKTSIASSESLSMFSQYSIRPAAKKKH